MADFRRWVLALAVLTLVFTGLASAQVNGNGGQSSQMSCTAYSTPNTMRSESFTELTGDVQIVCTGGTPVPAGTAIPTANISVVLPGIVTSRIIGNASEALLLIDEPGTTSGGPFAGYGAAAPLSLCSNSTSSAYAAGAGPTGCGTVYSAQVGGYYVMSTSAAGAVAGAANAFQGVVNGSTVTFNGIPILPPVSSGISRVFRITNIRLDAHDAVQGGVGPLAVADTFTISPPTALQISNNGLTVGYIEQSLQTSVSLTGKSGTTLFSQSLCTSASGTAIATLNFKELFGTAFKPRFSPSAVGGSTTTLPIQAIPGFIYDSESGFIPGPGAFGGGLTISSTLNTTWNGVGVADFGTRFQAVFTNIPAGVSVFVANQFTDAAGYQAQLVTTTTTAVPVDGFPATGNPNGAPEATPLTGTTAIGSPGGTVVWEVVAASSNVNDTISFPVTFSYSPSTSVSTSSTVSVALSYNPIETATGANIPRFAGSSTPPVNIVQFSVCQTALLFPYVVYAAGYDTGLVIANTSSDPFSTIAQSGTCSMSWYQGTSNPPTNTLGAGNGYGTTTAIPAGTVAYMTASANLPAGFIGYGIAVCNFQYAHGFAIVQDLGGQRFGAGYLALILQRTAATTSLADISLGLEH